MTLYVLIVLWFPAGYPSGKAMLSQEFNSVTACETAKREVLSMEKPSSDGSTLLRAKCVPKG